MKKKIVCGLRILLGIACAIYLIIYFQKDRDTFDYTKMAIITNAVLIISNLVIGFFSSDVDWRSGKIIEKLPYIPFLLLFFIYIFGTIIKEKAEWSWFSKVLLSILGTANYTFPTMFALFINGDGASDEYKKKNKKITATTIQWSKNMSTTTLRDEDGNETRIDHWNV